MFPMKLSSLFRAPPPPAVPTTTPLSTSNTLDKSIEDTIAPHELVYGISSSQSPNEEALRIQVKPTHCLQTISYTTTYHHEGQELSHPANVWKDIPPFVVLTGPNGAGKSRFLIYIRDQLEARAKETKVNYCYKSSTIFEPTVDNYIKGGMQYRPVQTVAQEQTLILDVRSRLESMVNNPSAPPLTDEIGRIAHSIYMTHQGNAHTVDDKTILGYARLPTIEQIPSLHHAFTLLNHVFSTHTQQRERYISAYQHVSFYGTLQTAYVHDDYMPRNGQTKTDFQHYIVDTDDLQHLLSYIADGILGIPPWEEINKLFSKYGVDFKIQYKISQDNPLGLVFVRNGCQIYPYELSSGEHLILEILAWQYYGAGLSSSDGNKRAEVKKLDIMLLDEPDRHFDAKLVKVLMDCLQYMTEINGIQVIMTTHRTDTLAFVSDKSIFTIKRDRSNKVDIRRTHRLEAMFRLTSNLRELTNFHIKVHTESLDDATVYRRVYTHLLTLSSARRKQEKKTPENEKEIFSQRFQLDFYSLALDRKGGGGGCAIISQTVQRDILALENVRTQTITEQTLYDSRIIQPLGLIDADMDLDSAQTVSNPTKLKDIPPDTRLQLFFTKRHSLENYVYDPAFLFSFLSRLEIETWFTKDAQFKKYVLECQQALTILSNHANDKAAMLQAAFTAYFRYFIEAFVSIKVVNLKNLERFTGKMSRTNYNQLYGYLQFDQASVSTNGQTSGMLQITGKGNLKSAKTSGTEVINILETLAVDLNVTLTDYPSNEDKKNVLVDSLMQAQRKEISILSLDGKETYAIEYPGFFIYAHGHSLEEFIQKTFAQDKNVSAKDFKNWLIDQIATNARPLALPMDWVEVMRGLNARAREQANAIIKPEKSAPSILSTLMV